MLAILVTQLNFYRLLFRELLQPNFFHLHNHRWAAVELDGEDACHRPAGLLVVRDIGGDHSVDFHYDVIVDGGDVVLVPAIFKLLDL